MTTYEEVLARHEADWEVPACRRHADRAWLLEEHARAAELLTAMDYELFSLRGQLAALRSERVDKLFALFEAALPAVLEGVAASEAARERARNAWAGWTPEDAAAECAPMPKTTLSESMRERCAQEADVEVATGEHLQKTAMSAQHSMEALTHRAVAMTIAKRIRELR